MTVIALLGAALALAALVWLLRQPRHLTLREEERLLRDYFRRVDRQDRNRTDK